MSDSDSSPSAATHVEEETQAPSAAVRLALPVAVAVITALAFLPALDHGWVNWDDTINFLENHNYRGLSWRHLEWMFTTFHAGPYQPLSWLTLGLDYTLWGMDARGYHLTSLLFHVATVVAFYFLALHLFTRITASRGVHAVVELRVAATVAALLFGVHPLRAESVAWVTERRDVVSGVFFVLTLLAYLRAHGSPGEKVHRGWLALSLLAYTASLLGKGMGVTLPLLLVLLDVCVLRRLPHSDDGWLGRRTRPIWLEKLPYLGLAGVALVLGVMGQAEMGAVASLEQYGIQRRIGTALFATAFYLYKTFVPLDLSPLYPMPKTMSLFEWRYVLSGVALVVLTWVFVRLRHRWSAALCLWIAYLGMLAPVSGLTQMGPQIAADRYTYLPCLGWALLGGWCVYWLSGKGRAGTIAKGVAFAALIVLGALTWRQTKIWHDSVALWEHAGSIYPESHIIQQNWGAGLAQAGRLAEALERHQAAARLVPESAAAQNNIGRVLLRLGLPAKAEQRFHRAIELDPDKANAHFNLGNALVAQGKLSDALEYYRRALELNPRLVQARVNWANTLQRLDRSAEAERQWRLAIQEAPHLESAYENLATFLIKERRFADAVEVLTEGTKRCSNDTRMLRQLGWLRAAAPIEAVRDGEQALAIAERLTAATGHKSPEDLDLLAAAYAETGRMDEAVEHATRALELAVSSGKRGRAARIEERLRRYRAGRPFRLPP